MRSIFDTRDLSSVTWRGTYINTRIHSPRQTNAVSQSTPLPQTSHSRSTPPPLVAGDLDSEEEDNDLNFNGGPAYDEDHSWEDLQEDEFGNLQSVAAAISQHHAARRRRLLSASIGSRVRRGMIRYLQLIMDLSRAAGLTDMRPIRSAIMFSATASFIRAFFDENPLSQLGIIILRNGIAERLTDLSSSPEMHIDKLKKSLDTAGAASLQNGLDLAIDSLKSIPPYGHREALFLLATLSTCDPGNIQDSIKSAVANKVRVSVVGLSAELHICRVMATKTGGTYQIATAQDGTLDEFMASHATPPPSSSSAATTTGSGVSLVRMGFPDKAASAPGTASFVGPECTLSSGSFICPRCKGRTGELPAECHICGLTLVSSPHLARSYHHLFPVRVFEEVTVSSLVEADEDGGGGVRCCYGCSMALEGVDVHGGSASKSHTAKKKEGGSGASAPPPGVMVLQCPDCRHLFCLDCDAYIHEHLHSCPGCECLPIRDGEGGKA